MAGKNCTELLLCSGICIHQLDVLFEPSIL